MSAFYVHMSSAFLPVPPGHNLVASRWDWDPVCCCWMGWSYDYNMAKWRYVWACPGPHPLSHEHVLMPTLSLMVLAPGQANDVGFTPNYRTSHIVETRPMMSSLLFDSCQEFAAGGTAPTQAPQGPANGGKTLGRQTSRC